MTFKTGGFLNLFDVWITKCVFSSLGLKNIWNLKYFEIQIFKKNWIEIESIQTFRQVRHLTD